jgi:hypothetical protein
VAIQSTAAESRENKYFLFTTKTPRHEGFLFVNLRAFVVQLLWPALEKSSREKDCGT